MLRSINVWLGGTGTISGTILCRPTTLLTFTTRRAAANADFMKFPDLTGTSAYVPLSWTEVKCRCPIAKIRGGYGERVLSRATRGAASVGPFCQEPSQSARRSTCIEVISRTHFPASDGRHHSSGV